MYEAKTKKQNLRGMLDPMLPSAISLDNPSILTSFGSFALFYNSSRALGALSVTSECSCIVNIRNARAWPSLGAQDPKCFGLMIAMATFGDHVNHSSQLLHRMWFPYTFVLTCSFESYQILAVKMESKTFKKKPLMQLSCRHPFFIDLSCFFL